METSLELLIPKTENDITDEWIRKVVGVTPIANSVSVVGNIQDGVGFLSNLCRVTFQTDQGVKNILVKLLPTSPEYKAITVDGNFDEREIQFYSLVKPEILKIAPQLNENMCKVYCGRMSKGSGGDYSSMLVMEDLRPLGYQMYSPEMNGWEKNMREVVEFVATFHCASLELEQKSAKNISELFPFCMGSRQADYDTLLELAVNNVKRLDALLEEHNVAMEIREAYKEIENNIEQIFQVVWKKAEEHACLIHGDVWPPNAMVTDDNLAPVIIDWQCLAQKDPVIELSVIIFTFLPKTQINRPKIEEFCEIYWNTCESVGTKLSRNKEQFKQWFNTYGLAYAFFWFLFSFDSFPDDVDRLCKSFEFLQKEYKVCDILKQK